MPFWSEFGPSISEEFFVSIVHFEHWSEFAVVFRIGSKNFVLSPLSSAELSDDINASMRKKNFLNLLLFIVVTLVVLYSISSTKPQTNYHPLSKRVLVLGSNGPIGIELVDVLRKRGYKVVDIPGRSYKDMRYSSMAPLFE
jgi:hypothetical protein